MADRHLVKKRSYRLDKSLDDALEIHLESTGKAHNQVIREALELYLYGTRKKGQNND